jgi:hypothetical protein
MLNSEEFTELISVLSIEDLSDLALLSTKVDFVNKFSAKNENKFKFCSTLDKTTKTSLGRCLSVTLDKTWSRANDAPVISQLTSSCLNLIRLLSRDSDLIESFENSSLLSLIQHMANLVDSTQQLDSENVCVQALKSISNLVYNSKYAQEYYASSDSLIDALTDRFKRFSRLTDNKDDAEYQIMIFNLRILFLLTIFSKSLREKLKEKMQLTSYLTEIINRIMNPVGDQAEICYLKSSDIECIVEVLKLLFNLTMDITSVKANADLIMGMAGGSTDQTQFSNISQEEEILLTNLLSVLRDLMTRQVDSLKQNDLHTNIINLLTNIPTNCYRELLTPAVHSNDEQQFEGKKLQVITLILSFMSKKVAIYLEKPSGPSADELYPVLLLLSLMSKSNKTIRHFCRAQILPPLKTKHVIGLPQEGIL